MSEPALHDARNALQQGNYFAAIHHYQSLLTRNPADASLYLELSSCMIGAQQIDEALVIAKQARKYADKYFYAQCDLQLANIYLRQERYELAGQLFHQLARITPRILEADIGLSNFYLKTDQPSKACAVLQSIANVASHDVKWATNISLAMFRTRQADAAIDLMIHYMREHGVDRDLLSNALMMANYTNQHEHYQQTLKNFMLQAYPPPASPFVMPPRKNTHGVLKVGFVSADFYWHPVGYFLHSFLPYLRDAGIEITLYSNRAASDSLTEKLQASATRFTSIYGLNTDAATSLIRNDNLDILIDLSGHTAGHRLDVFHQRAAPLQASYLGYTESTHLTHMDYLFTDEIHTHPSEHANYAEKIVYFPTTRFCFRLPMEAPAIVPAPLESNGYVTLGSFANPAKISEDCVLFWGKIMLALPTARLKLRHQQWDDDTLRQSLLSECVSIGIAPGRIEFYGHAKYDRYLASHQEIDVILDTPPFSGGTTTCEALWMGVPVITIPSQIPAGRQGVSILHALYESFWVVPDAEHAIALLKTLQKNPQRLREFKGTIRDTLRSSPLGDGKLFAKQFAKMLHGITQ
jgi:protein O-GlcNAc transferase